MLRFTQTALAGLLAATSFTGVHGRPQDEALTRKATTACNNSPSLCSKNYNEVTFMGVHDSAFLRDASTSDSLTGTLAGNQYKNATQALDAGFRFLQAQVHNSNGTLQLCHSSCKVLDAGPLEDFLAKIDDWMGNHKNDVVTLLFVNADKQPVDSWGQVFSSSGIAQYSYNGTMTKASSSWPTLEEMISSNQRLVSFITDIDTSTTYPYLRDEFDYIFETSYEVIDLTGFNCTLDRPATTFLTYQDALSANFLSLVNHFKDQSIFGATYVPDTTTILTVNNPNATTDGNLGQHLQSCKSAYSRVPNFALVDFWSAGDPIKAGDDMNGLNDVTGRTVSDDIDDETADSGAGGVGADLGKFALVAAFAAALLSV